LQRAESGTCPDPASLNQALDVLDSRELTSRTNQSRAATRNSFDSAGDFLSQIDRERNGVPTSEAEALRRAVALSVEQYAPPLGMDLTITTYIPDTVASP